MHVRKRVFVGEGGRRYLSNIRQLGQRMGQVEQQPLKRLWDHRDRLPPRQLL